jgi:hypothetical protein
MAEIDFIDTPDGIVKMTPVNHPSTLSSNWHSVPGLILTRVVEVLWCL